MNQEERDWLEWLKRVQDGVVTQRQAAEKMGVSDRWVRKLLARMKTDGDAAVVHGLRGRSSNRRIDEKTQARVLELLRQPEWHDFGPTFASEQMAKRHDIHVSKETVRSWMGAAGLWKAHSRKVGEKHFWRPRRSGYGELVQWDTSNHDWLEGRGEAVRYLVKWIDDATSRSGGSFVQHDGTRENMGVLWQYIERQGRMVDVYTDRAAMFMVRPRAKESAQQRQESDRVTQIGRGLRELGIGWIPAYSPQAKGRVERSFGTDQDRLVKHLRLARVVTLRDANKYLEQEYWPEWNKRFARPAERRDGYASSAHAADRFGQRLEPCGAARGEQRLHVFVCRPALPDRPRGGESRNEGQTDAHRVALKRQPASAVRRSVCGDRQMWHENGARGESEGQAGSQRPQPRRQERLDGRVFRTARARVVAGRKYRP